MRGKMKIMYDQVYVTVVSGGLLPPVCNFLCSCAYGAVLRTEKKSEERIALLLNEIFQPSVDNLFPHYASFCLHTQMSSVDQ